MNVMAQETSNSETTLGKSFIHFRISEDRTKVFMDLNGISPHPPLSLADVETAWKNEGLSPKLFNLEKLMEITDGWKRSEESHLEILVAEILLPQKGKDGWLEFFSGVGPQSTKKDPQNSEGDSGRLDFRSVKSIRSVEKGQQLVRYHPPIPGISGETLLGQEIPAEVGKTLSLPEGEKVGVSPDDPNVLIALVSGYAEWAQGKLHVHECFIIDGAVDYKTGNIDYERSVIVKNDVQDGFLIRAGGKLEVGGSIGDSRIWVQGKVLIHGGFLGKGQGILNTRGEAEVGFISNQTLRAYENITIAKEAFNAKLFTKVSLVVNGPMVGGTAIAGLSMQCKYLGNELGTRTDVELGIDYLDLESRMVLESKIEEIKKIHTKIKSRVNRIQEAYKKTRRLIANDAKIMMLLRSKEKEIEQILPELEMRLIALQERAQAGYLRKGIELRVEGKLYPGVHIKVENQILRIPEEISGPRLFSYFANKIHMF